MAGTLPAPESVLVGSPEESPEDVSPAGALLGEALESAVGPVGPVVPDDAVVPEDCVDIQESVGEPPVSVAPLVPAEPEG